MPDPAAALRLCVMVRGQTVVVVTIFTVLTIVVGADPAEELPASSFPATGTYVLLLVGMGCVVPCPGMALPIENGGLDVAVAWASLTGQIVVYAETLEKH